QACRFAHPVEERDLFLGGHEGHGAFLIALQPHLQNACRGEEQGDKDHGDGHQPEAPHFHDLSAIAHGIADTTQFGHGIGDDGQHDHRIGSIERHVPVGRGDLGAVSVVVHRCQGMHEAPHTCAEERHDTGAHCPQHRYLVWMLLAPLVHHVEGKNGHHEERNGFQCREDGAQPQPVTWCADPEIVVASPDDAGDQCGCDDYIQPLVDDFTIDTGGLDQDGCENGAEDQFPYAFHPQMHYPPPEEFIQHQVYRVVEREQEHHGEAYQASHQHYVDHGFAT